MIAYGSSIWLALSPLSELSILYWLVVSTPLKNISQFGWLLPIYGKISNVPNHQPVNYLYIDHHRSRPNGAATDFSATVKSLAERAESPDAIHSPFPVARVHWRLSCAVPNMLLNNWYIGNINVHKCWLVFHINMPCFGKTTCLNTW